MMKLNGAIGLATVLLAFGCRANTAAVLVRCLEEEIVVRAFPSDSFTTIDPCAIVGRVQDEARQAATSGRLQGQALSGWDSVLVVPLAEALEEGQTGAATWQVQVFLRDSPYDLEAVVDRGSGSIELGLIHKPL